MSLSPGTRLGPYEILTPLGVGGMGEVYRARDSRLDRTVAIKTLPPAFARDPERLVRFEREARLLASVSHVNVAGIHGLEEVEEHRYLILEYVEGETLAARLSRGPLPVAEAMEACGQIAAGVAAAHEKGVVHRDLKPGNVMLTPSGVVKVVDFGLAKSGPAAPAVAGAPASPDLSSSPTIAAAMTEAGVILGTAAYMSPEQARGKPVDRRTDIWSLGCVLYECLAGRRAFTGETASDILAAILAREPDFSALPPGTPGGVRRLLTRCLEKDPQRRIGDAGEVRLALARETSAFPRSVAAIVGPRPWMTLIIAIAAVSLLALYALGWLGRRDNPPPESSRPKLTQATFNEGLEQFPEWSPDGSSLAYAGEAGPVRKIFIKLQGAGEGAPITRGGTDDIQPSWSPDGRTILFLRSRLAGRRLEPGDLFGSYDGGDVWAVDIATGKESLLAERAFNPSWSPDGTRVAVDASWAGPRRLWILDSLGRNPQQITTDVSEEVDHLRPRWSPDGAKLVFQSVERTRFDVRVVDLQTKTMQWVTHDAERDIGPSWSAAGRFIYFSSDRGGGLNLWRVPITPEGKPSGSLQQLTNGAGQDVELALCRDGRRLAFSILRQNADLWKIPASAGTGRPAGPPEEVIATTREDSRGAWSPDGASIAFNSDRAGEMNIWVSSIPAGRTRQLTQGPGGDFQPSWSPDGRRLAFFSSRSGNADIWTVAADGSGLTQVTRSRSIEVNPFFSPDGKQIAYQSDQGGRLEVWVMNADGGGVRPLTRTGVGGHFLRWTRDGHAILFRCLCGGQPKAMLVPVTGGDPEPLSEVAGGAHMSYSPDFSLILDAVGHKSLWVSPTRTGTPEKVFEFDDPEVRLDYPVWSPDGRWILVDRCRPQGGDIWSMEGFE